MTQKVELDAKYRVRAGSTEEVKLRVAIGNAQVGGSSVFVNGIEVAKLPGTGEAVIGSEAELAASGKCSIFTVVTDVNPSTDKMVVSYRLSGGPAPSELQQKATAENAGDAVAFVLRVEFES